MYNPTSYNVHIYPSPLTRESRMFRLTKTLAEMKVFKHIYLIGIGEDNLPPEEDLDGTRRIIRIERSRIYQTSPFLGRMFATLQWSYAVWKRFRGMDIACINAHSLPVLPLCVALKIRHNAKLVYDTHELETETINSRGLRKHLSKWAERFLIGWADHVFCVGDKIADWYQARYSIVRPTIIRNLPETPESLTPIDLRARFNIPSNAIVIIYVGILAAVRGIDDLLEIFTRTKADRHIILLGTGTEENVVKNYAARFSNIHHIPAVPSDQVLSHLAGADAGISMDIKGCLSYLYSLPNKFFEYMNANLPVLTGGMPEQLDIVLKYDMGWTLPLDTSAAAELIDGLNLEEINQKKAHIAEARKHLNWGIEEKTLLGAYRTLMALDNQ